MKPTPTAGTGDADSELHIRLDLAGLTALMKTIEGALERGRSELRLDLSGVTVTCHGSPDALRTLILTWRSDDDGGELEPIPTPQTRVLETLG